MTMDDYGYDPIKRLEYRVAALENDVKGLTWGIWIIGVCWFIAYYFKIGIFASGA